MVFLRYSRFSLWISRGVPHGVPMSFPVVCLGVPHGFPPCFPLVLPRIANGLFHHAFPMFTLWVYDELILVVQICSYDVFKCPYDVHRLVHDVPNDSLRLSHGFLIDFLGYC